MAAPFSARRTMNPLLKKDDVGRARETCYHLPGADFAYGRAENPDAEGAKEVTMQWKDHTPRPQLHEGIRDFKMINKKAIRERVCSARDQQKFRVEQDYDPHVKSIAPT